MPTTIVNRLVKEDWCCALWRVGLWYRVAGGGTGGGEGTERKACKVVDVMVKVEAWKN
jgi:hypothetical protein